MEIKDFKSATKNLLILVIYCNNHWLLDFNFEFWKKYINFILLKRKLPIQCSEIIRIKILKDLWLIYLPIIWFLWLLFFYLIIYFNYDSKDFKNTIMFYSVPHTIILFILYELFSRKKIKLLRNKLNLILKMLPPANSGLQPEFSKTTIS